MTKSSYKSWGYITGSFFAKSCKAKDDHLKVNIFNSNFFVCCFNLLFTGIMARHSSPERSTSSRDSSPLRKRRRSPSGTGSDEPRRDRRHVSRGMFDSRLCVYNSTAKPSQKFGLLCPRSKLILLALIVRSYHPVLTLTISSIILMNNTESYMRLYTKLFPFSFFLRS